ncbi:hypothetical protein [Microbacterium sp.]|uniref:hypothetical protein n=1 Tax=Microbacterium sp. TaxID=51671 RepID=UPI003A8FC7A6
MFSFPSRTADRRERTPRRTRSVLALTALGLFALVAPAVGMSAAYGAPVPKPTSITVEAHTDPALAAQLTGTPDQAMPSVLTAVGKTFDVTVSLWSGTTPASYPTDTKVTLKPSGSGTLALVGGSTAVIPKNQSSATFEVTYSAATPALSITGQIGTGKKALTATSASFPVELTLSVLGGNDPTLLAGTAGADTAGCTTVDRQHPMCGVVRLPNGATGNVALSLGVCPTTSDCAKGALVTQLIANLTSTGGAALYTRTNPAQMTIICDKSICGKGGVPSYRALWSQSATGTLTETPACPNKGVIGTDQQFCTDTVSSTRDNAGDLLLVVLFLDDVRGTI